MRSVILVLSITLPLAGCGVFDSSFVKACEEAIGGRLRAPSTYSRLELEESFSVLTADEYISAKNNQIGSNIDREMIEKGEWKARRLRAVVTYDAANAYGTPIRSTSVCEYDTIDDRPTVYASLVKVDGQTNSELAIQQLQNSVR